MGCSPGSSLGVAELTLGVRVGCPGKQTERDECTLTLDRPIRRADFNALFTACVRQRQRQVRVTFHIAIICSDGRMLVPCRERNPPNLITSAYARLIGPDLLCSECWANWATPPAVPSGGLMNANGDADC